ncbi:MAG TPA: helix-turn-helix domain-containing protein [Mesorhizobium sp.]|jgi:DNA-binding HxlR family transcriptional regulator|nr:helix-turn-helix domain-containing protein [Mesorhizobium sp.]
MSDPRSDANSHVLDERYPARRVLNLIADKWTPIVMYCLAGGTRRFGEMQRRIPGLSKKMLIQVLRSLERDGLVHREVFQVVPPKTEYTLTDLGRQLHEPIALLCRWAAEHTEALEEVDRRRLKAE